LYPYRYQGRNTRFNSLLSSITGSAGRVWREGVERAHAVCGLCKPCLCPCAGKPPRMEEPGIGGPARGHARAPLSARARAAQAAPGTKPRKAGDRLAASYINFFIANGGVVMPAFGGEAAEADARCARGPERGGDPGVPCCRAQGRALVRVLLGCSHAVVHASQLLRRARGPLSGQRCTDAPVCLQRAARRAGRTRCCRTPSPTARWSPCRRARCCSAAATSTASRSSSPPCVCPVREAERRDPYVYQTWGCWEGSRGTGVSACSRDCRDVRGVLQCAMPCIPERSVQSLGGW